MYHRGLGAIGEMTQYVFTWAADAPPHPLYPQWGPGTEHSTTAYSEQEAREILERAVGLPPGSPVKYTLATAPLPTMTVGGRQVLDPVASTAYQEALREGKSLLEAVTVAQDAAKEARGVLNLTPGPEGSKVVVAVPAPTNTSVTPESDAPQLVPVKLAGFGGKWGVLLGLGLALAMLRKGRR